MPSVPTAILWYAIGLVTFGLVGCSSMPQFDAPEDSTHAPTVSQVIDKIQCEIAEARDDPLNNNPEFNQFLLNNNLAPFGQWVANATLSLTVQDTGGLSPTSGVALAYIDPLVKAGTSFMFGGNLILYQQRSRIFTQTYTIQIANIPAGQTCASMHKDWHSFNLEGDLGLKSQIDMGLHAFHSTVNRYAGTSDNFGATASFDVFKGITSLGPLWTLVHFKGPVGGLGYLRDDLHKIAITFQPVAYRPSTAPAGVKPEEFAAQNEAVLNTAIGYARSSNSQLVTTQAIQSLSQVLSSLPAVP